MYLDQTLERTIKRFEDEYPESKPKQSAALGGLSVNSRTSSYLEDTSSQLSRLVSKEDRPEEPVTEESHLTRSGSNASLAAKALAQEEGRMHRFGQGMRRELLKPTGTDDALHGTSVNDAAESPHLTAFRNNLESFSGENIREAVEQRGVDNVIKELGINAQELANLERDDPEAFAKLKNAQMAAEVNSRPVNQRVTISNHGSSQGNSHDVGYAM